MPQVSDAERRGVVKERAKQGAEGLPPQSESQPKSRSQSPSQKQKQQPQPSGAPFRRSEPGPLWARTARLLFLSLPGLFLIAFSAYVIRASRQASHATSAPGGGAATSAPEGGAATSASVAAGISGAAASLDGASAGATPGPGSLTPQQLFGLWTHSYSVEAGSRRKLQLVSKNGSSLDMDAFNTETTIPGLTCTTSDITSDSNSNSSGSASSTRGGGITQEGATRRACNCTGVPDAPHLQCCEALGALRKQMDSRGPRGELPPWTALQPGRESNGMAYPRPPWVRGAPSESIPLTHEAQADLWRHQNPAHRCAGNNTRFLVSYWDNPHFHGMGSHLHLMTAVLGLAVTYGRVFGLLNYSFHRAQHDGCRGPHFGSFGCYFHLPTSEECDRQINDVWKVQDKAWRSARFFDANRVTEQMRSKPTFLDLLASDEPYIVVSPRLLLHPWDSTLVPTKWGKPWLQMVPYISFGENRTINDRVARRMEVSWWRSQAVRYLLRFPSVYLCHLLNFARHQTFGLEAAQLVASRQASGPAVTEGGGNRSLGVACGAPPSVCQAASELANQTFKAQEQYWLRSNYDYNTVLNPEPWAPHPLVRVHVRGTDKKVEMRILGFRQYEEALERMRREALPGVKAIWISSEEQRVIEDARKLSTWTVYTLEMEKKWAEGQNMPEQQWLFAKQFGLRDYVEASLCNLFIAELSDGFLFALQSNWDRLANELRLTSGRLRAPFIPLNQGEW